MNTRIQIQARFAKLKAQETEAKRADLTPADQRDGAWFKEAWTTYCRPGMHLRAIHYKLVSVTPPVMMPPGVREHNARGRPKRDAEADAIALPYENTKFCWRWMCQASLTARSFQYVDARLFEEHRSPRPQIHSAFRDTPEPGIHWYSRHDGIKTPKVDGYEYGAGDQPYTVEVWCEKSTLDDILEHVCSELKVNYQPLAGMFSVTRTVEMLCRLNKPTRIFYISDFDAAGVNMPQAFAELLHYYTPLYARGRDIKMVQLALTQAQVLEHRLPSNIVDDKSAYTAGFIAEYGQSATELDALEAIHPGLLERLVREAVEPYIDHELPKRCAEKEDEAQAQVENEWDELIAEEVGRLKGLKARKREIEERLRTELAPMAEKIAEIQRKCEQEMAPFKPEMEAITNRVQDADILPLEEECEEIVRGINDREFVPEMPDRAEPNLATEDGMEWLCETEEI
jgi:hypothetical protein